MGSRIVPPATAFVASRGQKRPRREEKDHLAFIRTLPCLVKAPACDGDIQAHHIRYTDLRYGKRDLGRERADDWWTVPLCRFHHDLLHRVGDEQAFWRKVACNPCIYAMAFYINSGDDELCREIIARSDGSVQS